MNLVDWTVKKADGYKIPSEIPLAIAAVETGSVMGAVRARPGHRWLWDCEAGKRVTLPRPEPDVSKPAFFLKHPFPGCFQAGSDPLSEFLGQQLAWGPFQMPGSVLRQGGYRRPFVDTCTDPEVAAAWACRHLSYLRDKYFARHGWKGVVAAFKAGRPRRGEDGVYSVQDFIDALAKQGAGRFL